MFDRGLRGAHDVFCVLRLWVPCGWNRLAPGNSGVSLVADAAAYVSEGKTRSRAARSRANSGTSGHSASKTRLVASPSQYGANILTNASYLAA